jgi:F420-0:gamma-glutamyl ligase
MGVVNEVQQLDKNTEMTPVTLIRASYYIKEEISMLTLMMEGAEDVFFSIFVRAV